MHILNFQPSSSKGSKNMKEKHFSLQFVGLKVSYGDLCRAPSLTSHSFAHLTFFHLNLVTFQGSFCIFFWCFVDYHDRQHASLCNYSCPLAACAALCPSPDSKHLQAARFTVASHSSPTVAADRAERWPSPLHSFLWNKAYPARYPLTPWPIIFLKAI